MNKIREALFGEIVEMLIVSGAEGGTYTMLEKTQRGVTYLLCDQSDRLDGVMSVQVYAIPSKDDFISDVRNYLGEGTFDVHADDTNEAVWEVLNRYEIVNFDNN